MNQATEAAPSISEQLRDAPDDAAVKRIVEANWDAIYPLIVTGENYQAMMGMVDQEARRRMRIEARGRLDALTHDLAVYQSAPSPEGLARVQNHVYECSAAFPDTAWQDLGSAPTPEGYRDFWPPTGGPEALEVTGLRVDRHGEAVANVRGRRERGQNVMSQWEAFAWCAIPGALPETTKVPATEAAGTEFREVCDWSVVTDAIADAIDNGDGRLKVARLRDALLALPAEERGALAGELIAGA